MGKVFYNVKKNNKGVSLVEVLVTVAIVVILAGPLINSFLNARSVNSNARVIQNGTIVAQDTAEEFGALSLEQLLTTYASNLKGDLDTAKQNGLYTFEDIEVSGANGETFKVDVTLDASTYTTGANNKIQVNNVNLPEMSSLYGSDAVMLYTYYTKVDENLKDMFSGKLDATTLSNLYNAAYRQKLSKETDINISCSYSSGKYRYNIELIMMYHYKRSETDIVTVIEKKEIDDVVYTADQDHIMYLVCPVFDLCTRNVTGNISYATDMININYTYTGADDARKDLYFYIAQQEAKNLLYNTKKQVIHPDRINLTVDSLIRNPYDNDTNFRLYTNINGDETKSLTHTDKNSGIALYDMKVKVKYKDKVIAEFSTAK